MSNVRLWAIGNATNISASFSSTNGDTGNLPANVITHTGGEDGDYIQVPDCSGSDYFNAHHISIAASDASWNVSIWADDSQNGRWCWSPGRFYADGYFFSDSEGYPNGTIMIYIVNENPVVGWAAF